MCLFGHRKKHKKIDFSEISYPTNLRIIKHIGINKPEKINVEKKLIEYERNTVCEIIKSLNLRNVPINKKTIEFAEKFMKENGGIERYKQEVINKISKPTNFRHVQHIGIDENNSYQLKIISKNERKKVKEILSAMNIGIPISKNTVDFAEQFMKENGGIERYEEELKNHISGPHGFVHVQRIGFNSQDNKLVSNHQIHNAIPKSINNSRKLQREQEVPISNTIRRINPSDPTIYNRLNSRR